MYQTVAKPVLESLTKTCTILQLLDSYTYNSYSYLMQDMLKKHSKVYEEMYHFLCVFYK